MSISPGSSSVVKFPQPHQQGSNSFNSLHTNPSSPWEQNWQVLNTVDAISSAKAVAVWKTTLFSATVSIMLQYFLYTIFNAKNIY